MQAGQLGLQPTHPGLQAAMPPGHPGIPTTFALQPGIQVQTIHALPGQLPPPPNSLSPVSQPYPTPPSSMGEENRSVGTQQFVSCVPALCPSPHFKWGGGGGDRSVGTYHPRVCVPALPPRPLLFSGRGKRVSRHPPPNSLSPVYKPYPMPPSSMGENRSPVSPALLHAPSLKWERRTGQ